jgi:hypothetical protein
MAEKEKSIIEQIEESRTRKDILKASVEEAKRELPKFKEKINQLIISHIPKPEVEEVTTDEYFRLRDNNLYENEFGHEKETDTILEAKIPTAKGKVEVTIKSSAYPLEDIKTSHIKYVVDVLDLDYTLEIDGNGAKLKSKDIESSEPRDPMNVIVGMKYHTWPKWEREVNKKDLDRYSELLDRLSNPSSNTEFKGSTPKIINVKPIEGISKLLPKDFLPKTSKA